MSESSFPLAPSERGRSSGITSMADEINRLRIELAACHEALATADLISAELLELVRLFERMAAYEIWVKRRDGDEEGAQMTTITLNLIRDAIARAMWCAIKLRNAIPIRPSM